MSSRVGECGSGVWADKQGLFGELSELTRTTFLDRPVYALPIDDLIASFELRAADGSITTMPIYGQFAAYLDEKWRMLLPVSANARYQLRWVLEWAETHGPTAEVAMTYGDLKAPYNVKFVNLDRVLEQM
jgi:hypothetical protein